MTTFFFILLGLLSLTTLNRCASTRHDNQDETVTNALSVQRGRTSEISKPLLHLVRRVIPSEDFQLNFLGEPWERCGETRPDIVTSSYLSNHTLLFTHFGCKERLVLLKFRVSSPRRQVRVLNAPLKVLPSQHPLQGVLNGFQIKPVHNTNLNLSTATQETAYDLTVTFSPDVTTDLCLYSFELLPNTFPIPEHGQLLLPPNITRIPCGLAPLVPVKYTLRYTSSKIPPSRDYVLVRIWPRGAGSGLPLYGIVDIEFQQPSGGPAPLKTAHSILVLHSGYTPVPASYLLPSDFLTTDISKQMRIHVEATDCGVFVSHMTPINLADTGTTLLTSPDLISESVAFRPIVNNCFTNSTVYASDISGHLLWSLSISVRVNILYNISTFDFVLDSSQTADVTSALQDIFATFGENCTVNLSRAPVQGNLHWTDSNVQFSTASLVPANVTGTLLYTSLDGGINDGFAFRTECGTNVSYIAVFIMGLVKDPSHSVSDVNIDVYLGYATQLGPHVLHLDYEQMDGDELILIFIHDHDLSFYQISEPHTAETVLPLSTFNSMYNPIVAKSFTISQWINGLAWVVPLNVSGLGFALIAVEPGSVSMHANIHAQPPPTNEELFTPDVTITVNHPLVLDVQSSNTRWTVISTSNLDVKAARRSVVYNVVIPPKFGSLCFYRQTCNHSLSTFTHEDLRSGTLSYYRTLSSKLDGFLFEIDGTQPQWFVIKSNNVIEDPCNVKPKFVPVMSNVSLVPSMFASQLVEVPLTDSTAFSVVSLPSQGYLSLQKGNTVTLSDLTSGKLNYEVVNSTSPATIDSSAFVTVYNNTGYFFELVFVHLKNQTLPPHVHVRDLNTSTKSTELGNNFILTDFPFLVDIVHFVIIDEPVHGQIVHHGRNSKTTVLSKNCSFTHASLKRGEIQYVISEEEDVNNFSDSLYFALMLPSILTPVFLPNKTYSLAINYKKDLSVVSNLTVSLLNKMDTLYKYGVLLNRNIHIPEDMDAQHLFMSFTSKGGLGSFFKDSSEQSQFLGEDFQNSQLFYFLTQVALKLMHTGDNITLETLYYPQQNNTRHRTPIKQVFTINVFWSLVYFKEASIERELTNSGSDFSFYIRRKGTILKETYITLNVTGITPGVVLTCPNNWVGNNQQICVNESLTRIALHPDTDQVEIFSTALVDKSVGGFEGNGQIEFQILGEQNAIPLPGNDTAVVRLNELEIGFSQPVFTFRETEGKVRISAKRSGNLVNSTAFLCVPGKIASYRREPPYKLVRQFQDYYFTFQPNQSSSHCTVEINNDEVFDGVKQFEVVMYGVSKTENRVRLGLNKAIVNVTDEEDRPVIQFDPAVYSANRHIDMLEPATNCTVDETREFIRVTRIGDITRNTSVRVTSSGSLNHLDQPLDFEVLFKEKERVLEVPVVIKAHLEEPDDNGFNLTLAPTSSDVQVFRARIGEINQLIINIRNYQIKGPLFPAAPVVTGRDSSHPLTCVTPCDNITTNNDTCPYEELCSRIDITASRYEWEESSDGVSFTKVEYFSWLASTSSAKLDPAFLKPGYHYRCAVSPTSIEGNRGGTQQTRTSQPYKVSAGRECSTSPLTTVTISPFREVGENSDDRIVLAPSEVVKITISVQNINNTFPLVSMSRLRGDLLAAQNAPNSNHKCSNFLPGMHSLLGRQAFVGVPRITSIRTPTLNKCTWTFESWHVVKDLVDSCNARSSSNEMHAFDLNFYVSYFSGHHTKNSITDHVTKTVLLDESLKPPPNPLEALVSTSSMTTVRLELLALKASTRSRLEVVLKSTVVPADGSTRNLLLLPHPHISSSSPLPISLDLAASPKRNSNSSTQLWVLNDFSKNIPNNYNVTFRCGPRPGYCSPQAFHFRLVENTGHPLGYQIAISTNFTIRTEGDYTIANLSVSPRNILRENVRLCLTGLTACHSWSKETVDGCMSSKISTIRNVLDLAGLALQPNICSITGHSEYFSQSRLYTEIKFETRKLEIEDSWFFLANYTFVGDVSLAGQYHNESSLKQIDYEAPSTPGPTEGISMAIFVVPSVVTMVVTIAATVVIVCVVLCTYCRSKSKALEPVDCHATYQRSTRVIRTRITPTGEEYEMTQIITQKGVDPNLYIALALEGTREKRRMMNNFRSLPQLPVIKEEPSTHDHRVVCTSTERSTADPSPVSNYTMDGEELADHVLDYLAISAPTPSVSRTRLHSDL